MTTKDEIQSLRRRLLGELSTHKTAIQKISDALEALKTVEHLLENDQQIVIPGTGDYANLGPGELVLTIIEGQDREWTIPEILKEARRGGKNLDVYKSAYSVFYTALHRLVGKGSLDIRKSKPGERKGTYYRARIEQQEESGSEAESSEVTKEVSGGVSKPVYEGDLKSPGDSPHVGSNPTAPT